MVRKLIILTVFIAGIITADAFSKDISSEASRYVKEAITIRQNTQKEEDNYFKEREKLMAKYEALKEEKSRILEDIKGLKEEVELHKESIRKIESDISKIDKIKEQIYPFLKKTYERLEMFIKEDLPFLTKERYRRIRNLHKVLSSTDISIGEKYRKLMEALFIEAEYGNTIEVYQDRIKVENEIIYANIFRLGRVCLFFQSLDKSTTGYFDPSSGWRKLPKRYNKSISLAIEIAKKRRPVELIELPIGRIRR